MTSAINPAYPVAVSPTTQSVRDNFQAAKDEIEALQTAAASAGTVSSVALSLPAEFDVSGSPVTGGGTLTATKATQTANYGWFGPTSGSAAAPTFRAMVPADMPTMSATVAGKVPTPPNDATKFLDGTGAWSTPAGGGGLTNWTDSLNSTTPNATIKVSALTATNAATNLDAAVIAKGTGSLLAQIPDNATTGGNKRGANAVDWQMSRTAAARVASGDKSFIGSGRNNSATLTYSAVVCGDGNQATNNYAFIGGGQGNTASASDATIGGGLTNTASGTESTVGGGDSNTASGTSSTVAGGRANTATANYSTIAGGHGATTRGILSMYAYSGHYIGTKGDAQFGRYVLRCLTTSATPKVITVDNGTASATNTVTLPNNSTYTFQARMTARNTSNGDSAAFIFSGLIRRGANAAATALAAAVTSAIGPNDSGAAAWTVAVTADTTLGALKIEVTGAASTNIAWAVVVDTTEVTN